MRLIKFRGLDVNPAKLNESTVIKPKILPESKLAFQESAAEGGGPSFLLPKIEAIHAGVTRNNTNYPAEKLKGDLSLKSGVYSWTSPYPKPVIFNHDTETEVTGRIQSAYFTQMTSVGREGIIVVPKITEDDAIEDILEGRLLTVSIGATTDACICNICGTDIVEEGFCGHMKGETYDGKKAEWIVGNVWFDELSWVNVPSDQNAMIVDIGQIPDAEAYGQQGEEIFNLGKKSTEWLVSSKLAVQEGLITKGEKKGESTLPTVEELQAQLAEMKTTVEALTTEKESLTTKVEELTNQLGEAQTAVESQKTELEVKTTEAADAVAKTAELQTTVESLEQERTSLLEQNTSLTSEIHKSVAERVVDLKVSLGKESKDSRDGAIEKHLTRSVESLNDSLVDLLTESTKIASLPTGTVRTIESVQNPAVGSLDDVPEAGVVGTKEQKELSVEDVLKNLLTGPAFAKRN